MNWIFSKNFFEKLFGNCLDFFWEFFSRIYWEMFFGRIFLGGFLGGFFGRIFGRIFLGGILWEEYNKYFDIEGIDCLSRF